MSGAGAPLTEREKRLLRIIRMQDKALCAIGPILSEIGESRSRYADAAWAAFSWCLGAVMAAQEAEIASDEVTLQ